MVESRKHTELINPGLTGTERNLNYLGYRVTQANRYIYMRAYDRMNRMNRTDRKNMMKRTKSMDRKVRTDRTYIYAKDE